MKFTRRELAAAGLALGAGCLSGGSNVRYPGAAEGEGEPLVEDGATAAATDGTGSAPPDTPLATDTRGVYEEVRWFGNQYDATIRTFRDAVERARATVERVRNQGDINDNTLAVVQGSLDDLVATIREEVEPHFNIGGLVERRTTRHVEETRTFANRGDIDRAQEELDRLDSFLESLTSRNFVLANMSSNPVRNRLLSFLRTEEPADEVDDDTDTTDGELYEVWDPRSRFTAYVYGGESRLLKDDREGPFDERARSRYESAFEPAISDESRGVVYALARQLPEREEQPNPIDPDDYRANAIAVQAFEDVESARAARTALLEDGPVTREVATDLGGTTMDRIYYRAVGDVTYAFLLQAAELLVVVAPSEVAWNERIGWTDGLERTWLWSAGEQGG